jgi:hypothetical protein
MIEKDRPPIPGIVVEKKEDNKNIIPGENETCILNIMYNKEYITRQEALLLMQSLSGALLIDGYRRTQEQSKKYL